MCVCVFVFVCFCCCRIVQNIHTGVVEQICDCKSSNFDVTVLNTVEPPNKGHLGTRASVLYSEVSFIRRVEMY